MESHRYEITGPEWARLLSGPVLVVLLLGGLLQAGARLNLLPSPRPTQDVDQTIMVHQIDASRSKNNAQILLLGDSSCLMNVNGRQLATLINTPTLNLGTLSFLRPEHHQSLLQNFLAANPDQVTTVLLLMHPDALRLAKTEPYHESFFESYQAGQDFSFGNSSLSLIRRWTGQDILQGRVINRLLPTPMAGPFRQVYGFSRELEAFMTAHHGHLVDPRRVPPKGNPEFFLNLKLRAELGKIKSSLNPGQKLWVGITPMPEGFPDDSYPDQYQEFLTTLGQWTKADNTLHELPALLPNHLFATKTHLNQMGVDHYTKSLAQAITGKMNPARLR